MEYITIADFAERAGVTPQAIYKRLKADLAPYLVESDGVKLVNEEALNLFKVAQQTKEKQRIKELESQVEELESLIESLKAANLGLTEKLAANSEKLLEILEKQTAQAENFQILLAQQQQVQTSLIEQKSTVETDENKLKGVDTNLNQPRRFSLFGWRRK